jgi:ferredoxin
LTVKNKRTKKMVASGRSWAAFWALALSSPASIRSAAEAFALPVGQEPNNKATQIMQGTGPVSVDMNRYNLESLDDVLEQWRLSLRQKAAEQAVTLFLDTRSPELFVDVVNVRFPRQKDSGLGIELAELEGGREDGLGITVVTGLVEGGPAEAVDILPGDVIAKVNLLRRRKRKESSDGLADQEESMQLMTEGLGYDATVDALRGLPAADDLFEEVFQVQLKRIRRKPRIKVKLQYPPAQGEDTTIELFAGENLRMGMLLRGVALNDALAQRFDAKESGNCGANGICRTCSVSVLKGGELLNPQRPNEKQIFENAPRWRLACKAIVGYGMRDGDMTIRVNPTQFD